MSMFYVSGLDTVSGNRVWAHVRQVGPDKGSIRLAHRVERTGFDTLREAEGHADRIRASTAGRSWCDDVQVHVEELMQ